MPEYLNSTQQHVMSHDGMSPEGETGTRTMMPPPFQLMASPADPPGGDPKKKAVPPTNDHPVTQEDRNRVRPKPVPAEIVQEIGREVKGIEDLRVCGEVIIVHSPCYSAEIEMVMDMVNKGEMDYETGKKQILDRLTYLLQNEFKNADGEVNDWAETNKGEGTVENEGNMGADYYKLGLGGPQYLALTSWNDATDPSQGANNYTVYRHEPPGKDEDYRPEKPFPKQEYGTPLTSKSGGGKGDSKAKHVGNGYNIDLLLLLFTMLGAGAKVTEKPAPIPGRAKTIGSGTPALHDMRDDPKKGPDNLEKNAERKSNEENQKAQNTGIRYRYYPAGGPAMYGDSISFQRFMEEVKYRPNARFEILEVYPIDKNIPSLALKEVRGFYEDYKASHSQ